jgi:hypothetical protein
MRSSGHIYLGRTGPARCTAAQPAENGRRQSARRRSAAPGSPPVVSTAMRLSRTAHVVYCIPFARDEATPASTASRPMLADLQRPNGLRATSRRGHQWKGGGGTVSAALAGSHPSHTPSYPARHVTPHHTCSSASAPSTSPAISEVRSAERRARPPASPPSLPVRPAAEGPPDAIAAAGGEACGPAALPGVAGAEALRGKGPRW